jgi:hypothetical protein
MQPEFDSGAPATSRMTTAPLTAKQNARLRKLVKDELCSRVPRQLHLAPFLKMPQGNLSRFLEGSLGGSAALAIRVAALLDRSVEDVLGLPKMPKLVDDQEERYPSRILAARAAYTDGVPLQHIRAVLSASLHSEGDPGPQWWLKMMIDGHLSKHGNKKDTAWALGQVQPPGWSKGPSREGVKRRKRR